jgi:hypothetical protein
MRDISFVVSPIPDHAFFEQRSSSACSATTSFRSRAPHEADPLTSSVLTSRRVPGQSLLAASRNSFRPEVILALGSTFLAAQLSNAVLATKAGKHNPDLIFCGKPTPGLALDILHDPIRIIGKALVLSSHHLLQD